MITYLLFPLDTMYNGLWTFAVLSSETCCQFDLFLDTVCFDAQQVVKLQCVIYQVDAWSWINIWESSLLLLTSDTLKYFPVVAVNMAHVEWECSSKTYHIHFVWLAVWHFQITQNGLDKLQVLKSKCIFLLTCNFRCLDRLLEKRLVPLTHCVRQDILLQAAITNMF